MDNNLLEHWKNDEDGRLAYITICDQFTRMVFRKQLKAFSLDKKVLGYV